jgi:hypothetical protein
MDFSSNLIRSVHGINFTNNILPTFARYGHNYNFDNVDFAHEGKDSKILDFIVIEEQIAIRMHLEDLQKQRVVQKLHYPNSCITWAYFKVNNNQPMDLFQNQITRCIICHNNATPPIILAMHIRCRKGVIAYHKFNRWHNNHEKTCKI